MNTGAKTSLITPASSGMAPKPSAALPDLEIRLSAIYSWILIVFGVLLFFPSWFLMFSNGGRRTGGLGVLILVLSIVAAVGGNYWRHHLPVMVRMTMSQLCLPCLWPRRVVIDWKEITEIEKKTLTLSRHGIRQMAEFVCIKLKSPIPATDPLSQAFPAYKRFNEALSKGLSHAILGGYDIALNPQDQVSRTADWFIAECGKRMAAAGSESS